MHRVAEAQGGHGRIDLKKWSKGSEAQMWKFDGEKKVVVNKNWKHPPGWCLGIPSNGNANDIKVMKLNTRWWSMFKYDGNYFYNFKNQNKVLDVKNAEDNEHQKI